MIERASSEGVVRALTKRQVQALRATARIALLGALGCAAQGCDPGRSPPAESPEPATRAPAEDDAVEGKASAEPSAPATDEAKGEAPASANEAATAEPPADARVASKLSDEELARCDAVIKQTFPDGARKPAEQVPKEALDCCMARARHEDALYDDRLERAKQGETGSGLAEWEARSACCGALSWRGSMTCTPWGPPPPPCVGDERPTRASPPRVDLRDVARETAASRGLAFAALDVDARELAIATWRGRMVNEHESAAVFEALAGQLRRAGFERGITAQLAGFAVEEREHGIACGAVVEALGAEADAPPVGQPALPEHPDASPREAALRNLLSVCCLSETVAVALIGAERLEMPAGPLRELLTRLWADEIGHANLGWRALRDALAVSDDPGLRARLGVYLRVAFAALERHELALLPARAEVPPGGAALGLCDGRGARALFAATVVEVIVPALERLGLPAREAWARRAAPPPC
ncbi:MAG: hypothetical protein H6713_00840 [Myxococcales bacterium]|nr:hypothetical protein [Myxococcales bacterium]